MDTPTNEPSSRQAGRFAAARGMLHVFCLLLSLALTAGLFLAMRNMPRGKVDVRVELPRVAGSCRTVPLRSGIAVSVGEDGSAWLKGEKVTIAQLQERLSGDGLKAGLSVILRVDGRVPGRRLSSIVGVLARSGRRQMHMVVSTGEKQ